MNHFEDYPTPRFSVDLQLGQMEFCSINYDVLNSIKSYGVYNKYAYFDGNASDGYKHKNIASGKSKSRRDVK